MSLKRLFLASVLALVGVSASAFAQSSTNSTSSGSSSSTPPCEDACCFKQSVVDGKVKFECLTNWCQATCQLVYPKGQDGKPDLNKKPSCGCQDAPPNNGGNPPPSDDTSCREGKVCKEGKKCVGKLTGKEGSCKFNLLRGGCYCDTGSIISNPVNPISQSASAISGAIRSIGGR